MDRIVQEATRLEKRSKELLNKSKTMQENMDGRLINAYRKVYGDRWKDYYRKHYGESSV